MGKIVFTKENQEQLEKLALKMLFSNETINYGITQPKNIIEVLHTTSIDTLNKMRISLSKKIEELENQDEWIGSNTTLISNLTEKKELVRLAIGWRRFKLQEEADAIETRKLLAEYNSLKEQLKTPDQRMKEMEAALAARGVTV